MKAEIKYKRIALKKTITVRLKKIKIGRALNILSEDRILVVSFSMKERKKNESLTKCAMAIIYIYGM